MLSIDLAQTIQKMRAFMNDKEILEALQATGYEGTALPDLTIPIPSQTPEGTIPATTLEEINFEQKHADLGIPTEANLASNAEMAFQISLREKK